MTELARGVCLRGRTVKLRPAHRADLESIYGWRTDAESIYLWSAHRSLPSIDEFTREFEQLLLNSDYFVIESLSRREPIGFVYAYNTSLLDGFSFFSEYVSGNLPVRRVGAEAGLLFLDYLFTYQSLRKVYAEVYEFNALSHRTLTNAGFREEGYFRAHILYGGRYWGLRRLALYRSDWQRLRQRVGRLFNDARTGESTDRRFKSAQCPRAIDQQPAQCSELD